VGFALGACKKYEKGKFVIRWNINLQALIAELDSDLVLIIV
jgi:hypothetical protein